MKTRSLLLLACSAAVLAGAAALGQKAPEASTTTTETVPTAPRTVSQYFKGNLHTHTLWSDGDDYPEMVSDWYKQHGYQFLSLTDHNVLSDGERWMDESARTKLGMEKYLARFGNTWVERREMAGKKQVRLKPLREFRSLLEEPGKFLMIPGEEITSSYGKMPVHINGINLRDPIPAAKADSVAETIDVTHRGVAAQQTKSQWNNLAILNHPNFKWGVRAEDMIMPEGLKFFEVFNGHSGVANYGDALHASCERIWDIILALRLGKHKLPIVYGVATDDSHAYHEFAIGKTNPGRGWVMVRGTHLTGEAIVRGLHQGDFYASSGVTLDDVSREGNEVRLRIRGEKGITYKTQFIATMKGVSYDSKPVLDKNGKELEVTRQYDEAIGKVVAEVEGLNATYKLTGNELYVRARITSSKPHPNPYAKGDTEMAWTQPVTP